MVRPLFARCPSLTANKLRLVILLLALAPAAGCIMSLDVLALAEKAKKSQKKAATGRPSELEAVRRSWSGEQLRVPCERAVTSWSEMPRALFWSAMAQANTGNRKLAISRLQKAKALEPTFDGPWKVLLDIYRFEGKRNELADLRAEYQARFGKPLK
jgi:hypothetical protein